MCFDISIWLEKKFTYLTYFNNNNLIYLLFFKIIKSFYFEKIRALIVTNVNYTWNLLRNPENDLNIMNYDYMYAMT